MADIMDIYEGQRREVVSAFRIADLKAKLYDMDKKSGK